MAEQAVPLLKLVDHINNHLDGRIDAREVVVDCLADLMHFAETEGVDFEQAFASADHHVFVESFEREEEES